MKKWVPFFIVMIFGIFSMVFDDTRSSTIIMDNSDCTEFIQARTAAVNDKRDTEHIHIKNNNIELLHEMYFSGELVAVYQYQNGIKDLVISYYRNRLMLYIDGEQREYSLDNYTYYEPAGDFHLPVGRRGAEVEAFKQISLSQKQIDVIKIWRNDPMGVLAEVVYLSLVDAEYSSESAEVIYQKNKADIMNADFLSVYKTCGIKLPSP